MGGGGSARVRSRDRGAVDPLDRPIDPPFLLRAGRKKSPRCARGRARRRATRRRDGRSDAAKTRRRASTRRARRRIARRRDGRRLGGRTSERRGSRELAVREPAIGARRGLPGRREARRHRAHISDASGARGVRATGGDRQRRERATKHDRARVSGVVGRRVPSEFPVAVRSRFFARELAGERASASHPATGAPLHVYCTLQRFQQTCPL